MSKGTIWFDMDGTLADLYNVKDWLKMLREFNTTPYEIAQPMIDMGILSDRLNAVQARGWKLGIISLLSKLPQAEYDRAVTKVKVSWLKRYLPNVKWDEINIVPHTTRKSDFITSDNDILFDDEYGNRKDWYTGYAYTPENILDVLSILTET